MGPKRLTDEEIASTLESKMDKRFDKFEEKISTDISAMKDGIIESLINKNRRLNQKVALLEEMLTTVERYSYAST